MSLISLHELNNRPYLIGDLLISSPDKGHDLSIPTHLKPVEHLLPSTQQRFPSKLKQKLYIINPKLCLAIAGSVVSMKLFLKDVRQHFRYKPTNLDEINDLLFQYSEVPHKDLSYCVIYAEQKENEKPFRYFFKGGKNIIETLSQKLWIAGSGSQDYSADIAEPFRFSSSVPSSDPRFSIANLLMDLAKMLAKERFTLNTIAKFWGAGFELILFEDNQFKKLDDITYILLKGAIDPTGQMVASPVSFYNYKYHSDLLIITSFSEETQRSGITTLDITDDELQQLKSNNPPSTLVASRYCCFYLLDLPNGNIQTPSIFTENKGTDPGMVFLKMDEENRVGYYIRQDLHESIAQQMLQFVHT